MSSYHCPNGHDLPSPIGAICPDCEARVACVTLAEVTDTLAEVDRLRELLRDVAESGVAFDDERIHWVEIQIDRETWRSITGLTTSEDP